MSPARATAALAALLAALALGASGASASARGLFGMNFDGAIASPSTPEALQASQFARMHRLGVRSVRASFVWALAQPDGPGAFDFAQSDRLVEVAARNRIGLLPVVIAAPVWARAYDDYFSPPADDSTYAGYLVALIHRYGPRGSFWAQNPSLPRIPIRAWQIWNEPSLAYQWRVEGHEDWAVRYSFLVRDVYPAIKRADPHAKVVLAGLPNNSPAALGHLYHYGIRGYFDVVAIHPYTSRAHGVVTLARRARNQMRRHGDPHRELWLTELGLPASRGHAGSRQTIQTTDRGMASFLTSAYADLARARGLGVTRAYWYTWASPYPRGADTQVFDYAGLVSWNGIGAPRPRPALSAFAHAIRR